MTVGKVLWVVIIIKLFIIFAILKPVFFRDHLSQVSPDGDKAAYVAGELVQRGISSDTIPIQENSITNTIK